MSDHGVIRRQNNRIYPQPTNTQKSLSVHKRFDLPLTNCHIVYDFKVFFTIMKLVALIFC